MKIKKSIICGSFIILFIDQLTKYLIETYLANLDFEIIHNFLSFNLVYNKGAAFSLFTKIPYFIIIVSILSLFFLREIEKDIDSSHLKTFTFSLIYGGILGNLGDRVIIGSVRDFIDFQIFHTHFPTFNVADIAIVVGMIILIFFLLGRKEKVYADPTSTV